MSAFEYVSVMTSIIIGLALVDVLISANRLIRAGSAVRWDWAAPAASVLVVMTLLQIWWGQYQPTDAGLTIGQFLPLFVELVILFLLAAAALPDEIPADGLDLRAYYDRNGPYFWSLFTAALVWLTGVDLAQGLVAGVPILALLEARMGDLVIVGVFASLIFVRKRWWHAIALAILSTGPIGWLSRSLG